MAMGQFNFVFVNLHVLVAFSYHYDDWGQVFYYAKGTFVWAIKFEMFFLPNNKHQIVFFDNEGVSFLIVILFIIFFSFQTILVC